MTAVTLAVYDLTQGMAAIMSEGILGERIEGIWHTGIRAFGKEWFFGGGIQSLPIGVFEQTRGLPVSRLDEMGVTTKTEAQLQAHIGTLYDRFNVRTYNLLANNCNNFSDEICKFLCGHGISPDVIDLPHRIFSTPNGAMLRPVVENMTSSINGFPHTMDPFANMASSATSGAQAGFGPGGAYASAGATTNTEGSNFNFSSAHNSSLSAYGNNGNTSAVAQGTVVTEAVGLLKAKLEDQYLVSAAVAGYEAMGARLLKLIGEAEAEAAAVKAILAILAEKASSNSKVCTFTGEHYSTLTRLACTNPAAQSAALFLLRLMVPYKSSEMPDDIVAVVIMPILEMLRQAANAESFPAPFKNASGVVFALITISNWVSEDRFLEFESHIDAKLEEGIVDTSMSFLHSEKAEVRQIASALVHNVTLRRTSCTSEWINDSSALGTQILCGALDDVTEEEEDLVRKRRLAVALLLVRASQPTAESAGGSDGGSNVAAQMILDLGFDAIVTEACTRAGAQSRTGGREDAAGEATICRELLSYMRPTVRATGSSHPVVPGVQLS